MTSSTHSKALRCVTWAAAIALAFASFAPMADARPLGRRGGGVHHERMKEHREQKSREHAIELSDQLNLSADQKADLAVLIKAKQTLKLEGEVIRDEIRDQIKAELPEDRSSMTAEDRAAIRDTVKGQLEAGKAEREGLITEHVELINTAKTVLTLDQLAIVEQYGMDLQAEREQKMTQMANSGGERASRFRQRRGQPAERMFENIRQMDDATYAEKRSEMFEKFAMINDLSGDEEMAAQADFYAFMDQVRAMDEATFEASKSDLPKALRDLRKQHTNVENHTIGHLLLNSSLLKHWGME